MTVDRDKIYKGAARTVVSDPALLTSFPGRIESVINPSTYVLTSGWIDLGPTTEDGVTLRREAELSEGIALDQRKTNLDEGEPEKWSMQADLQLVHTGLENLRIAWQGGGLRTYPTGDQVAQRTLSLDAPAAFTERMIAIIQEDQGTGKMRLFAFRKAIPRVEGSELVAQKNEPTVLPVSFTLKTDPNVSEGYGQFGLIYEES